MAEPDANHIRRDMRDSVFRNAVMNCNLQRGKLQQHDARAISSKCHSHWVIFSLGRVNAPFCVKSKDWYERLQSSACLTLSLSRRIPAPQGTSLFSSYIFCSGGSLCLEYRAPTSFKTWLKPQHLPYPRKGAFPTQPPLHADHSPAFNIPCN